jgi:hypothetical protein
VTKALCIGHGKVLYNICPLMREVKGEITVAKIHYNSQKWSSEDPAGGTTHPLEYYNAY